MLFWNFFFPIFRDYAFVFPGTASSLCSDLDFVLNNWIFWLLVSIICCLVALVFVLVFCHAKYFRISSLSASNSNGINCHNHNHASHSHHHRRSRTGRSSSCGNTMSVVTNNNLSSTRRYSHPTHSNNSLDPGAGSISPYVKAKGKQNQNHYHRDNRRASSTGPAACTIETIKETDAEHQESHIISISSLSPHKKTLI